MTLNDIIREMMPKYAAGACLDTKALRAAAWKAAEHDRAAYIKRYAEYRNITIKKAEAFYVDAMIAFRG